MIKILALALLLAVAGEFLYRKFVPKVKAEAAAVESKVSAEVATVKADVAKVEAKLP